ncbi:glycosyltransferase family 2 protein [Pelagicoccus sp. SDUM812003]|uniref:glycosyltransferase family 2 protein n=1 Tax=Pelagicoccus sp. SDUM812003 TaxID=3041267 RepID=UPI00281048B0|nr:glycosyltransferase family 2 protein [Pelagicoccus sp. SDUM812003]MDQ8203742.1 glycosyltransferase family 2 protein [Pelagicoccus sp. SDUM812003]
MDSPLSRIPTISLAVPCHNEEQGLDAFLHRIHSVMKPLQEAYEIVLVDDGSSDGTWEKLVALQAGDERLKAVSLSRNFGKEAALTAAIRHCSGRAVIPIDADLQDPPELIPKMVELWREGYEVVTAQRGSRHADSSAKRLTARAFYRVFNLISQTTLPVDTGDFRLMDRKVVEAFQQLGERNRFLKGIFAWLGFRTATVSFDRDNRASGDSRFTPSSLMHLAGNGIFAFSSKPLRIWAYIGASVSGLAFAYAAFLFVRTLVSGVDVPGYASIMVVTLFLGGIQLIGLGVLGEYLGRVYDEVKARPLYVIRDRRGFPDKREEVERK